MHPVDEEYARTDREVEELAKQKPQAGPDLLKVVCWSIASSMLKLRIMDRRAEIGAARAASKKLKDRFLRAINPAYTLFPRVPAEDIRDIKARIIANHGQTLAKAIASDTAERQEEILRAEAQRAQEELARRREEAVQIAKTAITLDNPMTVGKPLKLSGRGRASGA